MLSLYIFPFFIQAILGKNTSLNTSISKPKATDRSKVVHALIKSSGPVANVRQLTKSIRNMTMELVIGKKINTFKCITFIKYIKKLLLFIII